MKSLAIRSPFCAWDYLCPPSLQAGIITACWVKIKLVLHPLISVCVLGPLIPSITRVSWGALPGRYRDVTRVTRDFSGGKNCGGRKEGPDWDAGPSKLDASLATVKEPEEDRQSLRLYVFQRTICPGRWVALGPTSHTGGVPLLHLARMGWSCFPCWTLPRAEHILWKRWQGYECGGGIPA